MIRIRVPATSANLGAGFDCMGLALPIWNEITFAVSERLTIKTDPGIPTDENNLIIRTMRSAARKAGVDCPNVAMEQINRIPSTSGLGSSAACIVAGALAANAVLDLGWSQSQILDFAADEDGHPDNVAPALLGGITACVRDGGHTEVFCAAPSDRYNIALLTPDFQLATTKSRSVLPAAYSAADTVYNVSHAVATFAAFNEGDPVRIGKAIGDRMHEQYRLPLIPFADSAFLALKVSGAYATYLSGAGPTLAAIVPPDFDFSAPAGWTLRVLPVSKKGASAE